MSLETYTVKACDLLDGTVQQYLEEVGSELESAAASGSPVDNGQLKNSWDHVISENEVTIGSPLENAVWNEFGTGIHAANGDGRKTSWYIPVEGYTGKRKPTYQGEVIVVEGRDGTKFYKTDGKMPRHTLQHAFDQTKPLAESHMAQLLREKMK